MGGGSDARRTADFEADVVHAAGGACRPRLARVQPHPDADRCLVRPVGLVQAALHLRHCGHRLARTGEYGEEGIAFGPDGKSAVLVERLANDAGWSSRTDSQRSAPSALTLPL